MFYIKDVTNNYYLTFQATFVGYRSTKWEAVMVDEKHDATLFKLGTDAIEMIKESGVKGSVFEVVDCTNCKVLYTLHL